MIFDEGLENIWKRHHRLAEGTRKAITEGWGLNLCAKEEKWYSDTVSAILVPEGFDASKVISTAFHKYNLALGAGLSKVAGKVFRIGHLGDLNECMLFGAISGAEMAMLENGIKVEPGSGAAAAANEVGGRVRAACNHIASNDVDPHVEDVGSRRSCC